VIQDKSWAEWRAGWRIVAAAAACYGTGIGMFMMTAGLFINPMQVALGWSKTALTFAAPVNFLMASTAPIIGIAADRWGARRLAIAGQCCLIICFIGICALPPARLVTYALVAIIGMVGATTTFPIVGRSIAAWFPTNSGAAFGAAFNGTALIAFFSVPLISIAIHQLGWKAGFLVLAMFTTLIGLPFVLMWLKTPITEHLPKQATSAAAVGSTWKEAIADWRYWSIFTALGLGAFSTTAFLTHLQPILVEKNFGIVQATTLGVIYAVGVSLGKVGSGFLLDGFWDYGVATVLFMLAAIGAVLLTSINAQTSMPLATIVILLLALGHGSEANLIAYFPLRLFGMRAYSTIVGTMATVASLGGAVGGFVFAAMADRQQSYANSCLLGAGCLLSASVLYLLTGLAERQLQLSSCRDEQHD
jgi:predicted MFS family arabinose efflux permease